MHLEHSRVLQIILYNVNVALFADANLFAHARHGRWFAPRKRPQSEIIKTTVRETVPIIYVSARDNGLLTSSILHTSDEVAFCETAEALVDVAAANGRNFCNQSCRDNLVIFGAHLDL